MSDAREASEVAKPETAAAKGGVGLITLVVVMLVTVLLVLGGVGGALYWLSKTGRLAVPGVAAAPVAAAKPEPVKTRLSKTLRHLRQKRSIKKIQHPLNRQKLQPLKQLPKRPHPSQFKLKQNRLKKFPLSLKLKKTAKLPDKILQRPPPAL